MTKDLKDLLVLRECQVVKVYQDSKVLRDLLDQLADKEMMASQELQENKVLQVYRVREEYVPSIVLLMVVFSLKTELVVK